MYEQLLKSSPIDAELHEKLATIYDHLNDSQGAERCYAFLVSQKEVKPECLLSDSRALSRNGKYDKAIIYYQKYRDVRPQDTIIFTRSNYFESHLRKSTEGINKLSLFQANWDKQQKKWVNIHPLSLNSDEYSVQHPALSPDGRQLYFASDMTGGYGGMDLYVSQKTINPGYPMNTRFDDFGYITDGAGETGYFSSNRNNGYADDADQQMF